MFCSAGEGQKVATNLTSVCVGGHWVVTFPLASKNCITGDPSGLPRGEDDRGQLSGPVRALDKLSRVDRGKRGLAMN